MLLQPQDRFAGFVVRALLGSGGSSEVYLAEDVARQRTVSLKILGAGESASPAGQARFAHEYDLAARLDHPSIVRVWDHGRFGGRMWLAAEYVDGVAASELAPALHDSRDLAVALRVLGGIAEALDYAHGRGVLHLDVKPANMLVHQHNPTLVKLSDFGSARLLDEPPPRLDGFVIASVPYAAPELLRGGPLLPATDQYALACSAVELLSGRPPFPGSDRFAIAHAQISADPPDISRRQHWIPHAVASILDKSLAKDPRARYDSCTEPMRLIAHAVRDIDPAD
ncbi:serine/threonine-protein kinase [Nocardia aurantia]|uniref:non-specific serine/threonine protein kinase n=1 Tax=Nocardia aurantia TaxID=2585199 RepID=A0A7K0DJU5_9NOCA|nr:serine/threonine-protein kinase [Nocardia aurantia]MQY26080.1 Serine/threonine-protein kinase PknF [Nocardia aurantia]